MRLKELRIKNLHSVRGLAKEAGVAERSIRAIESEEWRPSLATIRKLSEFFAIDPMEVDEFKEAIEEKLEE